MHITISDNKLHLQLRKYALAIALIVIAVGLLVLMGWQLNTELLKKSFPHSLPMNPVTAICFILSGLSLTFLYKGNNYYAGAKAVSICVFLVGIIKLLSLNPGFNFEVDQLLFTQKLGDVTINPIHNQMATNTAFNFVMLGIVLFFSCNTKLSVYANYIVLCVLFIGLFSLITYVYRVQEFYEFIRFYMTVYTAICFVLIAFGVLFINSNAGFMVSLTHTYIGASMARLLIPAIILLPLLSGYISLWINWKIPISVELVVSLLITCIIFILCLLIWYVTIVLNKNDRARVEAETNIKYYSKELTISEQRYFKMVSEIQEYAILLLDVDGNIQNWNKGAEKIKGYSAEEIIGKNFKIFYTKEDKERKKPDQLIERARTTSAASDEGWRVKKDGTVFWSNVTITALHDDDHNVIGFSKVTRDLTHRKKADEKFKNLLESAPDAMVIVDKEGLIQFANIQTERLFGYKKQELLQQKIEMLIPDRFKKNHPHHRHGFFNSPKVRSMGAGLQLFAAKSDGSEFPVEISLSPLETEEGMLVSAAIRDITERKAIEKKLSEASDRLVLAKNAARIGIWDYDPITNNLIWDNIMYELYGRTAEGEGESFDKWRAGVHPEDIAEKEKQLQEALIDKTSFESEFRIFWPDGSLHYIKANTLIQRDNSGKVIRLIGTNWDITDAKLDAETLNKHALALEIKNKELEQFAYVASHDLQEPLRTVSNSVELLEGEFRDQFTGEALKCLNFIGKASQRMSSLVRDLLEYSRLGLHREITTIDCNQLMQGIQSDLRKLIMESNTTLHIGQLPVIRGYKAELRLLFENLITNAIKFKRKDVPPQIEITAQFYSEGWQFEVKDNGIGIDPDHTKKIFLIFQRLHNKTEYDGTGIGLAHCAKIVDMHGGKIWVTSTPGKGSTFFFTISNTMF